jgi:hypothetical protein
MTERPPLNRYSDRGLLEEILEGVDRIEAQQQSSHTHINERFDQMSDAFEDLKSEVQEDIRDDSARDALIAQLQQAVNDQTAVAQEAIDRANLAEAEKQRLQDELDAKTQLVQEQVDALRGSDFPNADQPTAAKSKPAKA